MSTRSASPADPRRRPARGRDRPAGARCARARHRRPTNSPSITWLESTIWPKPGVISPSGTSSSPVEDRHPWPTMDCHLGDPAAANKGDDTGRHAHARRRFLVTGTHVLADPPHVLPHGHLGERHRRGASVTGLDRHDRVRTLGQRHPGHPHRAAGQQAEPAGVAGRDVVTTATRTPAAGRRQRAYTIHGGVVEGRQVRTRDRRGRRRPDLAPRRPARSRRATASPGTGRPPGAPPPTASCGNPMGLHGERDPGEGPEDAACRPARASAQIAASRDRDADDTALAAAITDLLDAEGVGPGDTVTLYEALPVEPPTAATTAALTARGLRVIVPITPAGSRPRLGVCRRSSTNSPGTQRHRRCSTRADPGLSVDREGTRLGQGGWLLRPRTAPARARRQVVVMLHPGEFAADLLPAPPTTRSSTAWSRPMASRGAAEGRLSAPPTPSGNVNCEGPGPGVLGRRCDSPGGERPGPVATGPSPPPGRCNGPTAGARSHRSG